MLANQALKQKNTKTWRQLILMGRAKSRHTYVFFSNVVVVVNLLKEKVLSYYTPKASPFKTPIILLEHR